MGKGKRSKNGKGVDRASNAKLAMSASSVKNIEKEVKDATKSELHSNNYNERQKLEIIDSGRLAGDMADMTVNESNNSIGSRASGNSTSSETKKLHVKVNPSETNISNIVDYDMFNTSSPKKIDTNPFKIIDEIIITKQAKEPQSNTLSSKSQKVHKTKDNTLILQDIKKKQNLHEETLDLVLYPENFSFEKPKCPLRVNKDKDKIYVEKDKSDRTSTSPPSTCAFTNPTEYSTSDTKSHKYPKTITSSDNLSISSLINTHRNNKINDYSGDKNECILSKKLASLESQEVIHIQEEDQDSQKSGSRSNSKGTIIQVTDKLDEGDKEVFSKIVDDFYSKAKKGNNLKLCLDRNKVLFSHSKKINDELLLSKKKMREEKRQSKEKTKEEKKNNNVERKKKKKFSGPNSPSNKKAKKNLSRSSHSNHSSHSNEEMNIDTNNAPADKANQAISLIMSNNVNNTVDSSTKLDLCQASPFINPFFKFDLSPKTPNLSLLTIPSNSNSLSNKRIQFDETQQDRDYSVYSDNFPKELSLFQSNYTNQEGNFGCFKSPSPISSKFNRFDFSNSFLMQNQSSKPNNNLSKESMSIDEKFNGFMTPKDIKDKNPNEKLDG
jgi:hypothetical protein